MSKPDESVKVVVRIRPMNGEETRNGNLVAAEAFSDRGLIVVKNPRDDENEPPKNFTFDAVFGSNAEQKNIYDICAASVVESVLNGYNGTIFAYGQTGAGKTHTMEGRPDPPHLRGIIPNSFQHIFDFISNSGAQQYLVRASYLEIYNEEIRDLLSKDPKNSLELKENIETGVYVKDLTALVVKNAVEIDHVMQSGKKNRSVGATLMNATSSRSHSIFTIVVECAESDDRGDHIRVGKLNLVDLAGSERQGKTGATGDRLKEATKINLSLAALGNVISALVDGRSSHIPYRDSKLTRLLQNSLGGNAKTVMCANAGPADYNYDETLSTLRYANRAKNIKNKPKINEDPKDAMLREYQEEIKRLKDQLDATQRGVIIDEEGKEVQMHNAQQEIIEKIVEREVVREVRVGVSEEEMAEIHRKAAQEKQLLMKQAHEDMKQLLDQNTRTAAERAELEAALEKEARDKKAIEDQKLKLVANLKMMEEKLIIGGEMLTKASEQEAQLREAERELRDRQQQEAILARELAEKEEANLQLEEHFTSLNEEVEVKTKKLKKLWGKYQAAAREVTDIQEEFQTERADMLDTIRQLTQNIKLKELIILNFIPEDTARNIEKRAQYNQEEDMWMLPKLELSGNQLRSKLGRPISSSRLRRPETEYSRHRKHFDGNPRYKYDNIVNMELDMPEKTTQDFEGPQMVSRVDNVLAVDIYTDEGDDVSFSNDSGPGNPYLHYTGDAGEVGGGEERVKEKKRPSSGRKAGGSRAGSRPKSASRTRRTGDERRDDEFGREREKGIRSGAVVDESAYPRARGLVDK